MNEERERLSGIETHWSIIRRVHDGNDSDARNAQALLIQQYGDAVRRYLIGALGSTDAADEVFQEFAIRFVRGDFKIADPERGRFRSFVKTAVYRLIVEHYRQQKKLWRNTELAEMIADNADAGPAQIDLEFDRSWRDELLAKAWDALESLSDSDNKPDFVVLRLCADHEGLSSSERAKLISKQLGRPVSAKKSRQMLHRPVQRITKEFLAIEPSYRPSLHRHLDRPIPNRIDIRNAVSRYRLSRSVNLSC